jgi:hypothetical protein
MSRPDGAALAWRRAPIPPPTTSAGLVLRIAGLVFVTLVLGALANRYGLGANLTVSSTRWRSLLDRRVIRCLMVGTGGTLRAVAAVGPGRGRSAAAITASPGALTDAPASGHRRRS